MVIKTKRIFHFFLLLMSVGFITGCGHTLKVNGDKRHYLQQETAKVKLTAKLIQGSNYLIKIKSEGDNVIINPNEFRMNCIPDFFTSQKPFFSYKKKFTKEVFCLNRGDSFKCIFKILPYINTADSMFLLNKLHILPGNFIMHNDKPLIIDTLKIRTGF